MKVIMVVITALCLGGCAAAGHVEAIRTASAHPASDEVSCMAECLDDGAESCEDCAADCLGGAGAARVATGE